VNCCSQIQMPERGVIDVLRFAREWDAAHPREPRNYLLEKFEEELLDALAVPR
jgi:hypothetical protein